MRLFVVKIFLLIFLGQLCLAQTLVKVDPKKIVKRTYNGETISCALVGKTYFSGILSTRKKNYFTTDLAVIKSYQAKLVSLNKRKKKSEYNKLNAKVKVLLLAYNKKKTICNPVKAPAPTPTATPTPIPPRPEIPYLGDPDAVDLSQLDRGFTNSDLNLLYERAGFGFSKREQSLFSYSPTVDQAVATLMLERAEDTALNDTVADLVDGKIGSYSATHTASGQRQALFHIYANTNNPYSERMALFLLSVWTVGGDVIGDETFRHAFWNYYSILRRSAYGSTALPDLGVEITKDPLMLMYLNNGENTKKSPNENYARELQELFTIGPEDLDGQPNYTETYPDGTGDISNAAKALTGLTYKLNYTTNQIDVTYIPSRHAVGPHLMYAGKPYQFYAENYEALVRGIIANHPNVKIYYAKEILKEYLTPDPPRTLIERFANIIAENNYNLRPAMEVLLKSKAFYHPLWKDTMPKNSVVFAVNTVKSLDLNNAYNYGEADRQLGKMQMQINLAPSVFWFNNDAWSSPANLMERTNFISQILGDTTSQARDAWTAARISPDLTLPADQIIETIRANLDLPALTVDQKANLVYFMNTSRDYLGRLSNTPFANMTTAKKTQKVLGVYYLLMSNVNYQME